MSRGMRIRLAAFMVLSAVGITYVAANYLGVMDAVLGRGFSVKVVLPRSGGLYVGSQASYRGVKVGEVTEMASTGEGVKVTVELQEGTRIPEDTAVYVHNLSAVGEQYINFVPENGKGPYLSEGDVIHGSKASMPVSEGELLLELNELVTSLDQQDLDTVITELGNLFRDTGEPLQRLIESGTRFINAASSHKEETFALLRYSLTVLGTQADQSGNITSFARSLEQFTRTLARSDKNLERSLQGAPAAVRQVDKLLEELQPTLPVLLGNLVTVNQVVASHLRGIEQLLVTYPAVIAPGFTGTQDGWGHVSLNFDQFPQPCTEGFLPPSKWQSPLSDRERPVPDVRCEEGPPKVMRGPKYAPETSIGRAFRSSPSESSTGSSGQLVDAEGNPVRLLPQGNLSVLGGDAWKWLLVGPVKRK